MIADGETVGLRVREQDVSFALDEHVPLPPYLARPMFFVLDNAYDRDTDAEFLE